LVFSPHLSQQPQQCFFSTLLPMPHGAFFDHRMCHCWKFILFRPNISEPARNTKGVNKGFDSPCSFSCHLLRISPVGLDAKRLSNKHLPIERLWRKKTHAMWNGDTRGHAVRDIPTRTDLMAKDVAQSHPNIRETENRHPSCDLTLASRFQVL